MADRLQDEHDEGTDVREHVDDDGVVDSMRETAGDVVREAERGRTARAPFIALSGVILVVATAVAIVLAIAFLAYFIA